MPSVKEAFEVGQTDALATFGIKEAGWLSAAGKMVGKGLQWGGKALSFLPTGVGNAVGGALGGVGGVMEGLGNGQGWRGALAHGAKGVATSAMPFGIGVAADMAGSSLINGAMKPRPSQSSSRPPMPPSIGVSPNA